MASLETAQPNTQAIPASAHFRAVAYLRGRLFLNGFRRKGGTGELIASFILYPIFAAFAIGPTLGAGFSSYFLLSAGKLPALGIVFWAIFVLWLLISINIAPPGLSFDPESLIRFPLSFPRYLTIRLVLGLLAASTVIGSLALLGAVVGISVAQPELFPVALAAALAFAVANTLFTRMVFAWVDRWLSTRRAREVFTGLMFAIGLGFQYLNVTFNGLGKHVSHAQRAAKFAAAAHFLAIVQPIAGWLPPGLASGAIAASAQHHTANAALGVAGLLAYALLFLAVFAWRTEREFRGESLSDSINTSSVPAARVRAVTLEAPGGWSNFGLAPPVAAVLHKEWIGMRRSTSQFYGLVAPVLMVVIFAGRLGSISHTGLAFPIGVAYSLLGLAAFSYNSLGIDQAGVQFYFLAPVRFRSILLAKNLVLFAIAAIQVGLVYGVIVYATGLPPLALTAATLLWVIFAMLTNAAAGNYRSLVAPRKIDPGKMARKQASQLSGLISVALTLATGAIASGLYGLGLVLEQPWLPIAALLGLCVGTWFLYRGVLSRSDGIALSHREVLIEELCKAG